MINSPIKAEELATEFSVVRKTNSRSAKTRPNHVLSQRMMAVAYEWPTVSRPSATAPTSSVCRSRTGASSTRSFISPTTLFLSLPCIRRKESTDLHHEILRLGPCYQACRKLQDTYNEEPPQDGERVVTLHGSATLAWSLGSIMCRRPRTLSSRPSSSWAISSILSRRGDCTRPWSSRRKPPACR